jgi:hypothetical protein
MGLESATHTVANALGPPRPSPQLMLSGAGAVMRIGIPEPPHFLQLVLMVRRLVNRGTPAARLQACG